MTTEALRLRRDRPEWFGPWVRTNRSVPRPGGHALCGLQPGGGAISAVTRLSGRLREAGGWADTELPLPPGTWRDLLTGRRGKGHWPLDGLFDRLPVALLVRS
ncbi:hypothetical protein NKH77_39620 [Streptomyces sp. M19]